MVDFEQVARDFEAQVPKEEVTLVDSEIMFKETFDPDTNSIFFPSTVNKLNNGILTYSITKIPNLFLTPNDSEHNFRGIRKNQAITENKVYSKLREVEYVNFPFKTGIFHTTIDDIPDILSFNTSKFYNTRFKTLLDNGLSVAGSLDFARKIARGISGINGQNYWHGDINPSNIMVEENNPIIIDMGNCVNMDDDPPLEPIGTRGYASPEQYDKNFHRSDVYSLGMIVVQALGGYGTNFIQGRAVSRTFFNYDLVMKIMFTGEDYYLKQVEATHKDDKKLSYGRNVKDFVKTQAIPLLKQVFIPAKDRISIGEFETNLRGIYQNALNLEKIPEYV